MWKAKKDKTPREIVNQIIDKTVTWSYIDATCQGNPRKHGVGRLLFLKKEHIFVYKATFREGTKLGIDQLSVEANKGNNL